MFKEITLKDFIYNPSDESRWILSAGSHNDFNAMTANWGGVGYIWNKPVAFAFVRPTRHTFQFIDEGDMFTLSFFSEEYADALKICGEKTGKLSDKIAEAKLTPVPTPAGNPTFDEADIVLECRKMYAQDISGDGFVDKAAQNLWYASGDFHKMFVGSIVHVLKRF